MNRECIIRHLKEKGRLDWLFAAVLMFIVTAMTLRIGGPVDYLNIGEPYTIQGALQDCYIEEGRGSKYSTPTLRIVVDGEVYTIWDDYMGMSMIDFQREMLLFKGETVTLQCVDSPGYDRHVAGLSFRGNAVYIRPEEAMEYRRQNSMELGVVALLMGLTGILSLVFAAGILTPPGDKKKTD